MLFESDLRTQEQFQQELRLVNGRIGILTSGLRTCLEIMKGCSREESVIQQIQTLEKILDPGPSREVMRKASSIGYHSRDQRMGDIERMKKILLDMPDDPE